MLMLFGQSKAGTWDFNPEYDGTEALQYKFQYQEDVEGKGYTMVQEKINTNNLSISKYMHGSGSSDYSNILMSEQKSTHGSNEYYVMNREGIWEKRYEYANSEINSSSQRNMAQSEETFAYSNGWYAAHPLKFDSLLMERTVGKSYQESVMMHHQIQYAQGYEGDLAVELNCTGPTNITKGKGLAMMKIDDHVVQGMVHIGQLVSSGSRLIQTGYNSTKSRDLKNPIINVDANYIGTFYIKKDMTVEIEKPKPEEYEGWLPCCFGGFSDMDKADLKPIHEDAVFDCTCTEADVSKAA
jgi:hypothetical protein